jgi:putative holliday junction resolvase
MSTDDAANEPAGQSAPARRSAFRPSRIAGIDYGTVRVGVAVADLEVRIAVPLETYNRRTPELDAQYFQQLVDAERITLFVVGLPVHLDGRESPKSLEVRRFGQWLTATTGVSVEFCDERFTTTEAQQLMSGRNLTKKQRKSKLDKLAAQIMLAAYLESDRTSTTPPQSLDD